MSKYLDAFIDVNFNGFLRAGVPYDVPFISEDLFILTNPVPFA